MKLEGSEQNVNQDRASILTEKSVLSRRELLVGAGAACLTPAFSGCQSGSSYEEVARELWRDAPVQVGDGQARLRALVRCATLAPSSHNTQCWRFRPQPGGVRIEPDLMRRCPVVDPDNHHLFVSLGCAAENLVHAASAHGLAAEGRFDVAGDGGYSFALTSTEVTRSPLFQAIFDRQCTRGDYDGRMLSSADLRLLETAGSGPGVRIILLTDRQVMERVLEFVVAGNTDQINDTAFVQELATWIRFSQDEAVRTGDGLFSGASGNPTVPRWLGRILMRSFFTPTSENDRCARQIRSSAGIAVFVGAEATPSSWVEVGRCYERFALQATALGIRNAFLNQPVEVARIRPAFAEWLGVGSQRPDLVVRFGRGPRLPVSLRRPVGAVLG